LDAMPDSLNLDEVREIPVTLGGRTFTLTQQRRSLLLRIVKFVQSNGESEGKKPKEGSDDGEIMETNFENSLPIIALMFGFEGKDETTKETIAFLREHLSPQRSLKVFKAWWELNEVDDFFIRRGNMLMDPDIAQWMKTQRRAIAAEPLA
jgi:hypothetical protein